MRRNTILVSILVIVLCSGLFAFLSLRSELPQDQGIGNPSSPAVALLKTIPVPPVEQRFDHLSIDLKTDRLFVSATGNNSIYVIDLSTDKISNIIDGLNDPEGILFIPGLDELIVGNQGNGVVDFFNGSSFGLIKSIKVGSIADNIQYDALTNTVYVGYGNDTVSGLAVINASSNTQIGNIALNDGHPEAFQIDANNSRIYVDDPATVSIDVINMQDNSLIEKWQLLNPPDYYPDTMALDQKDHLLFVGSQNPSVMVVYDTNTGKAVANMTINSIVDDTYYDSVHKLILASCGGGYVDVIKQQNIDSYQMIETLPTGFFAKTSLFVPQLNEYFVAAPQTDNSSARIYVYSVS